MFYACLYRKLHKSKLVYPDSTLEVLLGLGWQGKTLMGQEETFDDDGYIHCPDWMMALWL